MIRQVITNISNTYFTTNFHQRFSGMNHLKGVPGWSFVYPQIRQSLKISERIPFPIEDQYIESSESDEEIEEIQEDEEDEFPGKF